MGAAEHLSHSAAHRVALKFKQCGFLVGILFTGLVSRAVETPPGLVERPFAPRSAPRGATLFTVIPPAQSGVVAENRYDDPKMWNERYLEFTVGAIGTGVAIGDYDDDGRPDIFVVSKTGRNSLFRNLGNWKFEDVTEKAGVAGPTDAWKQGVTFADVNNDGLLDLYVCRFNAANLLYINLGNGTFAERAQAYGLAVIDGSGMAAFCDYDRDGWLDLYLQTNLLDASAHPNGQRDYLFRNNRNGTFTNATDRAGISGETQGHSATWWDYDNDGWPDLYVANDFAAPDFLYHNNGDGTFTNTLDRVVPRTPHSSMGADLGDVNNDGLIDFFVTDMAATTYEKDQRTMANERDRTVEDEKATATAPQNLRNALFLNANTGVMQEAAALAGIDATDWTWSARLEDLDNDGRLDLHVTNGMVREETNADLLTRMMTAESAGERVRILRNSPLLAERNLAFRNAGDLEFKDVSAAWGLDQVGVSFGAAFGDLDGDSDLDLIYSNYQSGVTVLRNDSDRGNSVCVALRGTVSNRFGIGSVVKIETASGQQVRTLVLARGYLSSSEPMVHFGLGDETRIQRLTVTWPNGTVQSFEDLGVGRHFTITEPEARAQSPAGAKHAGARSNVGQFTEISEQLGMVLASREDHVEETAQQRLLPTRHNRRGPSLGVGDLTGDGEDDICLGGTTKEPARLLVSTGVGQLSAPAALTTSPASVNDGPVLIFDADGDGRNDILVTRGGASLPDGAADYQPQLFLNGGNGLSPAPADMLPAVPINVGAAAVADLNHDGKLDVFLGGRLMPGEYPSIPRSALLLNRNGTFVDVIETLAPALGEVGMVTAALWSDVDGDGWVDLLLTLDWGNVKYFHNDEGKTFEDWSEKAGFTSGGTGWWSSITGADFNGDGRLDYAVGNVGLNTPYRASATHPAMLFYGEFSDGGGSAPQIIEARYDGDRVVPWRTRKQLGTAMRSVLKRYPKTDDYARATLAEIVGEKKLSAAQRLTATEFRSGVFLSQPDGRYRFGPLPRIAQIAPIFGMVAGDFDGDGKADLYALQNSYAPIAQVGRFDGGISQLLRGNGQGEFTAVSAAESNLIVTGDAKALAVLDLDRDGWPDFLITRNNSTTLAFRNGRVPGRHSVRVLLQGPAGNPLAIGARVTLETADGLFQTSEVYAGSGYFSQSTAACFFGWADGNAPKRVRVLWPWGAETTTEMTVPVSTLLITAPAR